VVKAAIVGCGNIAGFLDSPDQENILTHAHAYAKHTQTQLVAVCDPDLEHRRSFINTWGQDIRHYDSFKTLLSAQNIDMVSICSPTPFHFEAMVLALKDENIKTIICEKPFVQTQEELDELKILMHIHPKKILLNFIRRYDPSLQRLRLLIQSQSLGKILTFNGRFTKGIYHNGSHMLELIEHLCGDITSLEGKSLVQTENDFYGNFLINCSDTQGVLQNFSGENYALFELEIILSKGRVLIKDSGHTIEVETIEPSEKYKDYFNLKKTRSFDDSMNHNLYNTINFAFKEKIDTFAQHLRLSQKLLDIKNNLKDNHKLDWNIDE